MLKPHKHPKVVDESNYDPVIDPPEVLERYVLQAEVGRQVDLREIDRIRVLFTTDSDAPDLVPRKPPITARLMPFDVSAEEEAV